MKVIKHTGFVPVRALRSGGNYVAGQVFGALPDRARKAVLAGEVELVPIPPGIETMEVADPAPLVRPEAQPKLVDDPAVIPDDWADMHHLKKAKLAAELLGVEKLTPPDGMKAVEYAEEVIRKAISTAAVQKDPVDGDADTAAGTEATPSPIATTLPPPGA